MKPLIEGNLHSKPGASAHGLGVHSVIGDVGDGDTHPDIAKWVLIALLRMNYTESFADCDDVTLNTAKESNFF